MSKVDAQRAMREEKYARDSAAALSRRTAAAGGAKPPAATSPAPSAKPAPAADTKAADGKTDAAPQGSARCGHKSMNGRECTREAGHAEKSHRYS